MLSSRTIYIMSERVKEKKKHEVFADGEKINAYICIYFSYGSLRQKHTIHLKTNRLRDAADWK